MSWYDGTCMQLQTKRLSSHNSLHILSGWLTRSQSDVSLLQSVWVADLTWFRTGFAGSRSGALIATAWASLVHQGEQGFMHITQQLMQVRLLTLPSRLQLVDKSCTT